MLFELHQDKHFVNQWVCWNVCLYIHTRKPWSVNVIQFKLMDQKSDWLDQKL